MLRKLLFIATAIGAVAAVSGVMTARRMWRQWGIEDAEKTAPLPGDDLVPDAEAVDTRGIDIAAPPAEVWPWLVQMGYGRGGWYSYDQVDMNHPSAVRIMPEFQTLAVGDVLPTDPGGGFEVKVVEPEHAMVAYIDRALAQAQRKPSATEATEAAEGATPEGATSEGGAVATADAEPLSANVRATSAALDRAMPGDFAASWAFVLQPRDGGTRLIERFRARMEPPPAPTGEAKPIPPFVRRMLGFGVFVMVRRQLLGIRDRVEGRPIRPPRFVPGLKVSA
jgi:hypothetical protein